MANKKTILVAPLNWGLGHATRCIPIIQELLSNNFNVIIASDGNALRLLQKEFPTVEYIELPSYSITYPNNGKLFKWNLLLKLPKIKKTISEEIKIVKKLVSEGSIHGLISDNRLGIRSTGIPSAYITHQLKVISGTTTSWSTKAHQNIIKKFNECWVPDIEGIGNLSGALGHIKNPSSPIKYIGAISRMKKIEIPIKFDLLVLLSGPEPQRTLLEELLIKELKGKNKTVLLIQGRVDSVQKKEQIENITRFNYMKGEALEKTINESELIISRSGYTTIMDLAIINKKAFFIPTPGQYEQEYLAKRMEALKYAPYCKQEEFSYEKLKEVDFYNGLQIKNQPIDATNLCSLFESE